MCLIKEDQNKKTNTFFAQEERKEFDFFYCNTWKAEMGQELENKAKQERHWRKT